MKNGGSTTLRTFLRSWIFRQQQQEFKEAGENINEVF